MRVEDSPGFKQHGGRLPPDNSLWPGRTPPGTTPAKNLQPTMQHLRRGQRQDLRLNLGKNAGDLRAWKPARTYGWRAGTEGGALDPPACATIDGSWPASAGQLPSKNLGLRNSHPLGATWS